jgi:hypothetical protein
MHEKQWLLRILDEAYDQPAWHGPNLRGSIRGLTARQAAWRPAPGRHNIWEIVVHAAYWKYAVRRRLRGEKRGSFPLQGSNWFARSGKGGGKEWRRDVALLEEQHRDLRALVAGISPGELRQYSRARSGFGLRQIYGAALHDVYHAGQIQLLKRLQKDRALARNS